MLNPLMLLSLALVPPFLIAVWFYKKDTNPEPLRHSVKAVLSGALVCFPVLLICLVFVDPLLGEAFKQNVLLSSFISAFVLASIPEEFFKFVFLRRYIISEHCDEPYDMVFYGAMISIGFAAIENVFYVYDGGIEVAILRAFTAVPMHAICGAMMGFGLMQNSKLSPKTNYFSWTTMRGALLLPIMFHGLYDWPLFALDHENIIDLEVLIASIFWFAVIIYFLNRFRKIMNKIRILQ